MSMISESQWLLMRVVDSYMVAEWVAMISNSFQTNVNELSMMFDMTLGLVQWSPKCAYTLSSIIVHRVPAAIGLCCLNGPQWLFNDCHESSLIIQWHPMMSNDRFSTLIICRVRVIMFDWCAMSAYMCLVRASGNHGASKMCSWCVDVYKCLSFWVNGFKQCVFNVFRSCLWFLVGSLCIVMYCMCGKCFQGVTMLFSVCQDVSKCSMCSVRVWVCVFYLRIDVCVCL